MSTEGFILITPDSFEYSNKIKEDRIEYLSAPSVPLSAETDIIINSDEERKEKRSEDSSMESALLSRESGIIVNYNSLEQSQDASKYITPSNAEVRILIAPDYFQYSNERKEERSGDTRVASEQLSVEICSMINYNSLEQIQYTRKMQYECTQLVSESRNRSRR